MQIVFEAAALTKKELLNPTSNTPASRLIREAKHILYVKDNNPWLKGDTQLNTQSFKPKSYYNKAFKDIGIDLNSLKKLELSREEMGVLWAIIAAAYKTASEISADSMPAADFMKKYASPLLNSLIYSYSKGNYNFTPSMNNRFSPSYKPNVSKASKSAAASSKIQPELWKQVKTAISKLCKGNLAAYGKGMLAEKEFTYAEYMNSPDAKECARRITGQFLWDNSAQTEEIAGALAKMLPEDTFRAIYTVLKGLYEMKAPEGERYDAFLSIPVQYKLTSKSEMKTFNKTGKTARNKKAEELSDDELLKELTSPLKKQNKETHKLYKEAGSVLRKPKREDGLDKTIERNIEKAVNALGRGDKAVIKSDFYASPKESMAVYREYRGYDDKDYNDEVRTEWAVIPANRKFFNSLETRDKKEVLSYAWAVYNRNGLDILNPLLAELKKLMK